MSTFTFRLQDLSLFINLIRYRIVYLRRNYHNSTQQVKLLCQMLLANLFKIHKYTNNLNHIFFLCVQLSGEYIFYSSISKRKTTFIGVNKPDRFGQKCVKRRFVLDILLNFSTAINMSITTAVRTGYAL